MIPDGMPTLAHGSHAPGAGKACLMEYVALLAGEEWSFTPRCTNEALAFTAWWINDGMEREDRHLLLPFVTRLMGTDADLTESQGDTLWDRAQKIKRDAPGSRSGILPNPGDIPHSRAQEFIDRLSGLIDLYDEFTGRTTDAGITDADLINAKKVIESKETVSV